jgi:hypothetical protein
LAVPELNDGRAFFGLSISRSWRLIHIRSNKKLSARRTGLPH